jgi:hypothetical protein
VKQLVALAVVALVARADAQRELGWELRIPERVELVAGGTGTLPIALAVDRGLAIARDAAVIIDLAAEGGVSIKRRRLGRADAVDPDADGPRFPVPLRGEAAGDFAVKVKIQFWLCGTKVCRPVEAKRSVVIAVAPAAPAPPPPPLDAGVGAPPPDAGKKRR